jgi:hypothetical protein
MNPSAETVSRNVSVGLLPDPYASDPCAAAALPICESEGLSKAAVLVAAVIAVGAAALLYWKAQ